MNPFRLTVIFLSVLFLSGNTFAQDDFYPSSKKKKKAATEEIINDSKNNEEVISEDEYSTATDYYVEKRQEEAEAAYNERMGITDSTTYYEDENGNVRITNNYYNGDNYDFDNEYYDYEYASRIKRFRRNNGRSESTRLNSSQVATSYAVFCLKKKNNCISHNPIELWIKEGDTPVLCEDATVWDVF